MKSAIHAKRKTDAIIALKQDNLSRKLVITNMNHSAENLLGYSVPELSGKDFGSIIPERITEILTAYLDFSTEANDFGNVARRIPNFQIRKRSGEVIPVSLKVFNLVTEGHDSEEYELLVRDVTLIKKIEELKEVISHSGDTISENDVDTDLPSINSIVYGLDVSYSFLNQYSAIDVSFALLEVNNLSYYAKNYDQYAAFGIIGSLGELVKKCCRKEDIIGHMGDGIIGMVLIDCNAEDAKNVINRIKKKIDSAKITLQNGQPVSLSFSIAYSQLSKKIDMTRMIGACEAGLQALAEKGGNGVMVV